MLKNGNETVDHFDFVRGKKREMRRQRESV